MKKESKYICHDILIGKNGTMRMVGMMQGKENSVYWTHLYYIVVPDGDGYREVGHGTCSERTLSKWAVSLIPSMECRGERFREKGCRKRIWKEARKRKNEKK